MCLMGGLGQLHRSALSPLNSERGVFCLPIFVQVKGFSQGLPLRTDEGNEQRVADFISIAVRGNAARMSKDFTNIARCLTSTVKPGGRSRKNGNTSRT
jgi:hypothetical protein